MILIDDNVYDEMPGPEVFAKANDVMLESLTVTELPSMPMAKRVWLIDMPQLKAIPCAPNAVDIRFIYLLSATTIPKLRNAKTVIIMDLPLLTKLSSMPKVKNAWFFDLPSLIKLPKTPKDAYIRLDERLIKLRGN